jgi:hypothetical protein
VALIKEPRIEECKNEECKNVRMEKCKNGINTKSQIFKPKSSN